MCLISEEVPASEQLLPTKLKSDYDFGLPVCLSVHALTLVNILQVSWNLNMILISDIA